MEGVSQISKEVHGALGAIIGDMITALKEHEQNIARVTRWQSAAEAQINEMCKEIHSLKSPQERHHEIFQVMRTQFGEATNSCRELERNVGKIWPEIKDTIESIEERKYGRSTGPEVLEMWSRMRWLEAALENKAKK